MILYKTGLYNQFFECVKNNDVKLCEFTDEFKIEHYIRAIYTTMMEYIGLDNNSIQSYIEYFLDDDMINVEGKTNEQIMEEIRDDILNEIRKDFNYLYFEDKDRS